MTIQTIIKKGICIMEENNEDLKNNDYEDATQNSETNTQETTQDVARRKFK